MYIACSAVAHAHASTDHNMDVENQVEGSHIGRKCDIGYPVVQMDEWTDGRKVT